MTIYVVRKACGCPLCYIDVSTGTDRLGTLEIVKWQQKGYIVEQTTYTSINPKTMFKPCNHRQGGTQNALPGWDALVNRRKAHK